MVLPGNVNKAWGLKRALKPLCLSPHNVNIATTSGYPHAWPDSSSGLKLDPGLWTRPRNLRSFKEKPKSRARQTKANRCLILCGLS